MDFVFISYCDDSRSCLDNRSIYAQNTYLGRYFLLTSPIIFGFYGFIAGLCFTFVFSTVASFLLTYYVRKLWLKYRYRLDGESCLEDVHYSLLQEEPRLSKDDLDEDDR